VALAPWFAPSMVPVYAHTLAVRVRRHVRGHTRHPGDAGAIIRACIDEPPGASCGSVEASGGISQSK